jgi:hypothetical protein
VAPPLRADAFSKKWRDNVKNLASPADLHHAVAPAPRSGVSQSVGQLKDINIMKTIFNILIF